MVTMPWILMLSSWRSLNTDLFMLGLGVRELGIGVL